MATATVHKQSAPTGVDLYARFAFAGAVCCGITHTAVVPVDVVKTRIQLYPEVYKDGMLGGFRRVISTEGVLALSTGWAPTFLGYCLQGAFKFGGYEFWKKTFVDYLGQESAIRNRTAIYLASSAIAEFFADVALCPLEATRIRLVSDKTFAPNLLSAFTKIIREEGVLKGFYSGFGPILFKQVPYTMAKFVVYERIAETIYGALPKDKKISNATATAINLGSGLGAGLVAAFVSQPADTLLSKINKGKGAGGEGTIARRLVNLAIELGPGKLFLGLGTRFIMVGTLTAFQFAIYGDIKRMLNATGGVEIAKAGGAPKH
jgi:solute carrier family 25 phosphate transporter 3